MALDLTASANKLAGTTGLALQGALTLAAERSGTYVATLGQSNGTNDTAAINAALANPLGIPKRVIGLPGQTYKIGSPLVIGTRTTLDMTGCEVVLNAGSNCNMVQNRAVEDVQRTVSDATMTAASATLTSATAAFTSADVGRSVVVSGAGYGSGVHCATISTITNATTVTLSDAAVVTVNAATAKVYTRDRDVRLIGGTWTAGNNQDGPDDPRRHALRFRRVDALTVRGIKGSSTGGKYFICPGDVTKLVVVDIDLDVSSDGVHVQGPASNISISNVRGYTGDDGVAIETTAGPGIYVQYIDVQGSVTDVNVDKVHLRTTANIYKHFNVGSHYTFRRVTIRDITGHILGNNTGLSLTTGTIDDVIVDGVAITGATAAISVQIDQSANRIVVQNVFHRGGSQAVTVTAGVVVRSLICRNIDAVEGTSGSHPIRVAGTVTDMTVDGFKADLGASANFVHMVAGGVVTRLRVSNGRAEAAGSGAVVNCEAGTLTRCQIRNVSTSNLTWIVACNIAGVTVHLSDIDATSLTGALFVGAAGNVIVRGGGGLDLSTTSSSISGTLRVVGPSFPIDAAIPNSRAAGDTLYNTNAARACGVGMAMWTGTTWQNLATGLTYTPA